MLRLNSVTDNFSFEQLTLLPHQPLENGWHRRRAAVEFALAFSPGALWFSARANAPLSYQHEQHTGSFVEGLWERDVFELFIGHDGAGEYLEFNLSPGGAWWAASFDAPRKRRAAQPTFSVQTIADGASTAMRISGLTFQVGNTANVTAIIGQNPREYFSFAALPGAEPNFHQPRFFPIVQTHSN